MNHTPEPWQRDDRFIFIGKQYTLSEESICYCDSPYRSELPYCQEDIPLPEVQRARANAYRITTCVNACAGIEDPAATLQGLVNALTEIDVSRRALADAWDARSDGYHMSHIRLLVKAALAELKNTIYVTGRVQEPALSESAHEDVR